MADPDDYFDRLEEALKATGARPVRLVIGHADPRVTDAFRDEVAQRVAERLNSE